MTKVKASAIFSATLSVTSALLFIAGLTVAYLQYWRYDPPYVVINPGNHFATQMDGDTITVGRDFIIKRPVEITITRELIQSANGILTRVELPSTVVSYTPGKYSAHRIHEIPSLKPGIYELKNRLCWQANLLRRDCLDLPVLELDIKPPINK